jgi:hypothetical protein
MIPPRKNSATQSSRGARVLDGAGSTSERVFRDHIASSRESVEALANGTFPWLLLLSVTPIYNQANRAIERFLAGFVSS